jgi:hypothetical protein
MIRTKRNLILTIALLISILITTAAVNAQGPDERYFPETGHTVKGLFLDLYNSTPDFLLLFGYPITDEIIDLNDNQIKQYFQKARFDLVEGSNGQYVEIAPLGELFYTGEALDVPMPESRNCQFFPSTGKNVCYSLLDFYNAHQGSLYFGDPITNLVLENGRYVQYFENLRLEWQPDSSTNEWVSVTDLGKMYFDTRVGNASLLTGQSSGNIIGNVQLNTRAFVTQAIIPNNSEQVLYVVVHDQNYKPVEGATIKVEICYPDGVKKEYRPEATNAFGISKSMFKIGELPLKEVVEVNVTAEFMGTSSFDKTWFRIWW